jgi:hypothetical protein
MVSILYSKALSKFDLSSDVIFNMSQIIAPMNSPPHVNGSRIAAQTTAYIDASILFGMIYIIIDVHGNMQKAVSADFCNT